MKNRNSLLNDCMENKKNDKLDDTFEILIFNLFPIKFNVLDLALFKAFAKLFILE